MGTVDKNTINFLQVSRLAEALIQEPHLFVYFYCIQLDCLNNLKRHFFFRVTYGKRRESEKEIYIKLTTCVNTGLLLLFFFSLTVIGRSAEHQKIMVETGS